MFLPFRISLIVLFLVVLEGCATQAKPQPDNKSGTFVRVFPAQNEDDLHLGLTVSSERKAFMKQRCFTTREEVIPFVGTILGALVGSGIRLGVDAIDERLKQALAKYSKSYQAHYGGPFYIEGQNGAAHCWRVVRGRYMEDVRNKVSTEELDFDATIALLPINNVIHVQPLRLMLARPAPQKLSTNNQYGVAVSLNLSAGTDDGLFEIFDSIVLKDKVTYTGEPLTKYYGGIAERCQTGGLPIYCGKMNNKQYLSSVPEASEVQLTATVAETGAPSDFLKFVSDVFSGAKDDIGDALAEAAAARIDSSE